MIDDDQFVFRGLGLGLGLESGLGGILEDDEVVFRGCAIQTTPATLPFKVKSRIRSSWS